MDIGGKQQQYYMCVIWINNVTTITKQNIVAKLLQSILLVKYDLLFFHLKKSSLVC